MPTTDDWNKSEEQRTRREYRKVGRIKVAIYVILYAPIVILLALLLYKLWR